MKHPQLRVRDGRCSSRSHGWACLLTFLLFTACGTEAVPQDDESPLDVIQEVSPPHTADSDETELVPGDTTQSLETQDGTETQDLLPPEPEVDESPVSACTNPIDLTIINDSGNQVQADAGAFGQSCMGSEDIAACTTEKLMAKYGLTEGCSTCFAEVLACLVEECLLKCGADPSSYDCTCCKQIKGCTPTFFTCSGLPDDPPIDCGD